MNQYILSLGSNLPSRETHLQTALKKISEFAVVKKVAPIFENPPLLPENAPQDWYQFFLNTAVWIDCPFAPDTLLTQLQSVELAAGRNKERKTWAPRPLDIDIILMFSPQGELLSHQSPQLQIPHPSWEKRNFVVTPVMHLLSHTPLNEKLSLIQRNRSLKNPLCAFAAILNVTPDSFSEDKTATETHWQKMRRLLDLHPAVLDIGAESTRHGATELTPAEEWTRLEPFLQEWKEMRSAFPFTQLSLDTRHAETAEKALNFDVSILNDVSGLKSARMQNVALNYDKVVLMHSLSIPADSKKVLPENAKPIEELKFWLENKLTALSPTLSKKLIFDPGIGFGKTPLQSLSLLQEIQQLKSYSFPLLIGHSRKSFMNLWSDQIFSDRDFETLGVSAKLISEVEYVRIHNLQAHQRMQKSLLALEGAL